MTLAPVPITTFQGLNLSVDPLDVGLEQATDLRNVAFDWPGRIRTRDGTAQFNASTISATGYNSLWGSGVSSAGANADVLYAVRYSTGTTVSVDQIATDGTTASVGTVTGATGTFAMSHVDFGVNPTGAPAGGPRYSLLSFRAPSSAGITLQSIPNPATGSGIAAASGTPGKPIYVTVTPESQRIVGAGYFAAADTPSGANGGRSTVFFSDPAKFTWTASNWVQLDPEDGGVICGVARLDNNTWVFKNSKAYMFYGESPDSTGGAIFHFRTIDLPEPIVDPCASPISPGLNNFVCAGPDGIYYSTATGVWRITEAGPSRFSTAIDRVFSARDFTDVPTDLIALDAANVPPSLSWAQGKLWVTYVTDLIVNLAAQLAQLVYDRKTGQWSAYDLLATQLVEFGGSLPTFRDAAYYVTGSTDNTVHVHKPTLTDDAGTAIAWSYTSGYGDFGNDDEKRLRGTRLSGYGSATLQWSVVSTRSDGVPPAGSTTLGTRPTIGDGYVNVACRGRQLQYKLSGSGPAAVTRVIPLLAQKS